VAPCKVTVLYQGQAGDRCCYYVPKLKLNGAPCWKVITLMGHELCRTTANRAELGPRYRGRYLYLWRRFRRNWGTCNFDNSTPLPPTPTAATPTGYIYMYICVHSSFGRVSAGKAYMLTTLPALLGYTSLSCVYSEGGGRHV
jgi:hypothetical protein